MIYKVFPLILLIIISLTGCFTQDSQRDFGLKHFIRIREATGEYIYFPTVVNGQNNTFLGLHEYIFQSGKGTINEINVNNIKYLNISIDSNYVAIKVIRKNEQTNEIITYAGVYLSNITYEGGYIEKTTVINIYYSGNNQCDILSSLAIGKCPPYNDSVTSTFILNNGWNQVPIYKDTTS